MDIVALMNGNITKEEYRQKYGFLDDCKQMENDKRDPQITDPCRLLIDNEAPQVIKKNKIEYLKCNNETSLQAKSNCQKQVLYNATADSSDRTLILLIFGGLAIALLLTFLVLFYIRCQLKKKEHKEKTGKSSLQKDYEKFR